MKNNKLQLQVSGVKRRADKLQAGDSFMLDTAIPQAFFYTVISVTPSIVDTSVVYVQCKEKDKVCCHKNEMVIIQ